MKPDGMNAEEKQTDASFGAAVGGPSDPHERPPGVAVTPEAPFFTSGEAPAQEVSRVKGRVARTLWDWLRCLVVGPKAPPISEVASDSQPEQLKECLAMLDAHPGLRTTTLRVLGPQAAEQGASFLHEHIETEDAKGNARQTDIYVSHRCSNNHWLDQTVAVKGTCWCGAVLCSTPGCFAICQNPSCSAACCPRHRKTVLLDGVATTYCTRCFWKKYWFW